MMKTKAWIFSGLMIAMPLLSCSSTSTDTCSGSACGSGTDGGAGGTVLRLSRPDKLDVLFAIDNSASMGDKQAYLGRTIPDLVKRLVTPNCVDPNSSQVLGVSDAQGNCAKGHLEFPPVHDMHIGVVSSALGNRGGDICPDPGFPVAVGGGQLDPHNDDHGHLLNRTLTTTPHDAWGTQPDAVENLLAWFPSSSKANAGKAPTPGTKPLSDAKVLQSDLASLVTGVGAYGCGIESQLESWYRFLIQPDPYQRIDTSSGKAAWQDVDTTILTQRRVFLRPDSTVAVIVLTDENDSEIDVRSDGQMSHRFMSRSWYPPHATSGCGTFASPTPGRADCMSCANGDHSSDPQCKAKPSDTSVLTYSARTDWGYDMNLRHVHMKQKYGFDAQFPISRYVAGLTSTSVPNRDGEYPAGAAHYVGQPNCKNPLFAAELPDGSSTDPNLLCHLPDGPRTPGDVFYLIIGGVPQELVHFRANDRAASTITASDWTRILGKDPENLDYTGIDPHMIESVQPRGGLPGPSSPNTADPISGREWITDQGKDAGQGGHTQDVDLQYACIFPLVDAQGTSVARDCTLADNLPTCDCPRTAGALTPAQTPPLCSGDGTMQTHAKAYPSVREILLAKELNEQGIVSSICPIDVVKPADDDTNPDPLYGYRPAVTSLVDRMMGAPTGTCLSEDPPRNTDGTVACTVLALLPAGQACDSTHGFAAADADTISKYRSQQQASGATQSDLARPICALRQLSGAELVDASCEQSSEAGWCYVSRADLPTQRCSQAIHVSTTATAPLGARVTVQCQKAL
ncbi:MAG TPA: hypothetical protein VNO21_27530 [Polyangiaceae bacterium]|nr:hypothetical protein [Polyangiaceae bacterium]